VVVSGPPDFQHERDPNHRDAEFDDCRTWSPDLIGLCIVNITAIQPSVLFKAIRRLPFMFYPVVFCVSSFMWRLRQAGIALRKLNLDGSIAR
jgi:hypothetical protein